MTKANAHTRSIIYYSIPWVILLISMSMSVIANDRQDELLSGRGEWMQQMNAFATAVRNDRWTKKHHDEWVQEFCEINNLKPSGYKPEPYGMIPTLPIEDN